MTESEISKNEEDVAAPDVAAKQRVQASTARALAMRRIALLTLGPVVALLVGGYFYAVAGKFVRTEDAYVKANKVAVGVQVSGPIVGVEVEENQQVLKGGILFRIEPTSYEIALARTEAALQQIRTNIAEQKATYREKQAELQLANVNLDYAEREFQRQSALAKKSIVSEARYEETQHRRAVARQEMAVLRHDLARILIRLGGGVNVPAERLPSYLEARARRDRAKLDIRRTVVRAPFSGIAVKKPQLGQYVEPGDLVMSVVADTGMWIEANLKETQLTHVRVGQLVRIEVDTYPDLIWSGTVESISQATGAEFSILPPQNATGNWVKVVQRVPVRILVDMQSDSPTLRAGMSTDVSIETGQQRFPRIMQRVARWLQGVTNSFAAAAEEQP